MLFLSSSVDLKFSTNSSPNSKEITLSLLIFKFLNLIFSFLKYFLNEESLFCNFCTITGLLSISKSKYEPPCKSRPKLILFFKN